MKHSFRNDYSEACHPEIINALAELNKEQFDGYAEDKHCSEAAYIIKNLINKPEADVHFLSGGTQTNLVFLSSALRPHESVIAADTAHISTHETGAIEASGHKINEIPSKDGKLRPEMIQSVVDEHYFEHMVYPKIVFISDTTEVGRVYKKSELLALREVCNKNGLYLYIDGARLGMALTSPVNDVGITDIAEIADAFYIGGTKNGMLFGEALVITNNQLKSHMRYHMKQKGALLAKSAAIGIQFKAAFTNSLYFNLAENANNMAMMMSKGISKKGYNFLTKPESNQIFPIFSYKQIEKLEKNFGFYLWKQTGSKEWAVRIVISWATQEENINDFLKEL